jgi:hypothetical protein
MSACVRASGLLGPTEEAFGTLKSEPLDLVISDMARGNIPDDGLRLLGVCAKRV